MKERKAVKALLPLLRLYPWALPTVISLGILTSFLEGFGISLFIPFLQTFDQSSTSLPESDATLSFFSNLFSAVPPEFRFLVIALCIFSSILLKNVVSYLSEVISQWLSAHINHKIRSQVFRQCLSVSDRYMESHDPSEMINLLATETWRTAEALNTFFWLISILCTILIFVFLLQFISWKLTLAVAVVIGLISLISQRLTRQVKPLGDQAVEVNTELTARMWDGLSGMRVIHAFGREDYEQRRFDQASQQVLKVFFKLEVISGIIAPVHEVLSALLLIGILTISLSYSPGSLPVLLTFLFILYRLQPKVQQLDQARTGLVALTSSVQAVMSFLDPSDKPYILSGSRPFHHLQQDIVFDQVGFYYDSEEPALEEISIRIPCGKTTAFVGPSGAGKSTLINLICRFYEPTAGAIYVDGHRLQELNLANWRDRIAVVSQDVHMFSTTVKENIAYGRLNATDDEIVAAATLADAHEFITELPEGYDTPIGDRGIRLSGGQRQRLALARAIVRNPEILILDEATNALDSISENLIQEALYTLGQNRTVIIIAHRLSTIEHVSQIITLDKGRVVEHGNLSELLKLEGLFAKMYRLQHRNSYLQ
ncbi:MAG: ABC transporter ATP-binding protein [Cyanobacteria bacterium J069]|nr:MAG: ABC transporter ATP-binding protein [Cyanobacteria bacterium J069]